VILLVCYQWLVQNSNLTVSRVFLQFRYSIANFNFNFTIIRSRLSPSTGLCGTRHPSTTADHHDTPTVTNGWSAPTAGHRTEEPTLQSLSRHAAKLVHRRSSPVAWTTVTQFCTASPTTYFNDCSLYKTLPPG